MDHVENFRTAVRNHIQKNGKVDNDENTSCVLDMTLLFLNIFGDADNKDAAKKVVEDELICSICLDLVIDARVTNCNHLFCSFCLERWFLETPTEDHTKCPYCKRDISSHRRAPNLDRLVETVMSKYDLAYKVWLREERRRRWIQMMELQRMGRTVFQHFVRN